ncbi:MAG TPA: lamin tail domain-containing protein, partial [Verrucomicrobiae bacterium]
MVESPGPATRLTELVFSEIMYRPLDFFRGYLGSDLDFIEIYNAGAFPEDIGGYSITGDISFVFPTNYIKAPGAYVVIADKPKSIAAVYGISNAFNFSGNLPDDHGTIRLCNRMGAVLLEVNYSAEALWPQLANGKGRSLVLARPSYGIADRRAWDISEQDGGSPGGPEPIITNLLHRVCINEFLANSSLPEFDFLELYNKSAREIDLSGCSLSDSPSTNKFVFAGATIGAGSYLALDELSLGFSLKSSGDTIYFRAPNGEILDAVRYGPQDEEISQGRVPEGGTEFFPLFPPTPFAQNDTIYRADIVI